MSPWHIRCANLPGQAPQSSTTDGRWGYQNLRPAAFLLHLCLLLAKPGFFDFVAHDVVTGLTFWAIQNELLTVCGYEVHLSNGGRAITSSAADATAGWHPAAWRTVSRWHFAVPDIVDADKPCIGCNKTNVSIAVNCNDERIGSNGWLGSIGTGSTAGRV